MLCVAMLSDIILKFVMLSIYMLCVDMRSDVKIKLVTLSVVMLTVVTLTVAAPQ